MISWKLVLRSHPADVELSVIESSQSPWFRRPASISIQGEMMDAMYSSKLFDAPDTKFFWEFEAPSKTFVRISSKAERTRIQLINVSLMLMPRFAILRKLSIMIRSFLQV